MKASELRIGNFIQGAGGVVEVRGTNDKGIWLYDYPVPMNFYKPITLTDEWLLKFGFKQQHIDSENIISFGDDRLALNTYKTNGEYFWLRYYQHSKSGRIKYVHQLQNLYYALTGEELTIKK